MKIAEIRETIDALNWTRLDLQGATGDEFKRMKIKIRLIPRIEAVKALTIKPRFERDINRAKNALTNAEQMISDWEALQVA
jgi:hypothetical protein